MNILDKDISMNILDKDISMNILDKDISMNMLDKDISMNMLDKDISMNILDKNISMNMLDKDISMNMLDNDISMNMLDKDIIMEKYDKDEELLIYISETRNIHIERLQIIQKNKDNQITSFKKQISENEFIIIIHNNNVVFFDKNIDLLMFQEDISLKIYIIFHDIIQSNNKPHGFKKTNSIILINDKNILTSELCDEIVNIIDNRISENNYHVEKWEPSQNVNCLYFKSDVNISKDNEILDRNVYNLIGSVIRKLFIEHNSKSTSDSGYCFRKIYGPTRIHSDGFTTEAKNGVLPLDKIRNMSIIIALNDNYEGGEMHFPKQDYTVKLKKGDILCFPPYETHPHMVAAPLNRTYRYTINTWLYQ